MKFMMRSTLFLSLVCAFLLTLTLHYRIYAASMEAKCEGLLPVISWKEWQKGYSHEETFWRNWIKTQGGKWPDDYQARIAIDKNTPFQQCDSLLTLPRGDDGYYVLDVGAGPLISLGSICPGDINVDVTPCDPLAPLYNKILAEYSIIPFKRTQYALVEDLLTPYGPDYFHWVRMLNALDHTAKPFEGILQMLAVTKPGGIVHLDHARNEAENEKYRGFHQWNLDIDETTQHFIIWNKTNRIDVTKYLDGKGTVKTLYTDNRVYVDIIKNTQR